MAALTKAEMAERLYEELGLNKREAKEMVEAFFDEIRGALSHNEQVKLSGFGNFDLRDKKQRPGRNPKTGEEIKASRRRRRKKSERKSFSCARSDPYNFRKFLKTQITILIIHKRIIYINSLLLPKLNLKLAK